MNLKRRHFIDQHMTIDYYYNNLRQKKSKVVLYNVLKIGQYSFLVPQL
jgi:hypothetical protein